MPCEVPVTALRPAYWLPRRFLLLVTFAMLQHAAVAGSLTASLEIAQAKWKTVQLKNMPKDTAGHDSGRVQRQHPRCLCARRRNQTLPRAITPEFQGKVEGKLSFGVSIPRCRRLLPHPRQPAG